MDGQLFSQSLFALKGDDLRIIFALFNRTNISNIITSKTKDFLSVDEQDHLHKHLFNEMEKLQDISDDKLRFYLFLEMTKVLGIKGVRYTSEDQLESQSLKIVDETYKLLEQQETNFSNISMSSHQSKLQQILVFQIDKLYTNLCKDYLHFDKEVKHDLTTRLYAYIGDLSIEKQEKIKSEWQVTKLDLDTLIMIMGRNSLDTVLDTLRKVEGFSFYIYFGSIISTFQHQRPSKDTPIYGLIDPSNLSNLIGLGDILRGMPDQQFQLRLLPFMMIQMCLLYLSSEKEHPPIYSKSFIHEWKIRFQHYVKLKEEQLECVTRQEDVKKEINKKTEILNQLETNLSRCKKSFEMEKTSILSALKSVDLHTLNISPIFHEHLQTYLIRKDKIASIKNAQSHNQDEGSILKKVSQSFVNLYREYNLVEEERQLETILYQMVDDVITSTSPFCQKERERFLALTRLLKQLTGQKETEEANKVQLENKLASINQELYVIHQTITKYEQENYGLKDIPLTSDDFSQIQQTKIEETKSEEEEKERYLKKKLLFIHPFETKIKELEQQNKESRSELNEKEIEMQSLIQQAKRMEMQIEELSNYKERAERLEEEKQVLIEQKQQVIDENEKERKRLLQEQKSNNENKYSELKEAAEKQIQSLQELTQEWKGKYETLELEERTKQQALEKEMKRLLRENTSLTDSLAVIRQQFQDLNRNYQAKLHTQENQTSQQLEEFKKESERKIDQLTHFYKEQQEKAMENLEQGWRMKHEEFENKYRSLLAEKTNVIDQLQKDKLTIEQESQTINNHLIDSHKNEIEAMKEEKIQLHEKNLEMQERIIQLEKEWNEKLEDMKTQYESQMDQFNKKIEKEKKEEVQLFEELDDLDLILFGNDEPEKIKV
jgi:hypothetical protein